MKHQFRYFICALFLFIGQSLSVFSQTEIKDFLTTLSDSIFSDASAVQQPDSSEFFSLQQQLEESRLEEMNLRMEIEQMKLASFAADSLKLAQQKSVIDSLRNITTGIPVIVEEDTLFYIYTNRGGLLPKERALQTEEAISELGKDYALKPDSVFILSEEFTTDIMYQNKVILSLTDKDAMWENMSRDELANQHKELIIEVLKELKEKHSLIRLIRRILLFILVLVLQYVLIRLTNYGFRKLKAKLDAVKNKFLKPIFIKDYEFLSVDRQENVLFFLLNIFRYILIIIQLVISIPILFSIFPQTEDLAMQLFSYVLTPLKKIGLGFVHYIPNLFTIAIIWLVIRYVVKGIGYLASEIEHGRLKITGFYQDWAKPTYSIIRFLLYAFMIALIYPYLPGSGSPVFQGISVFVGLIVSFGSSSAIGNLVSGIIITYMRSFNIGDRIKINDIIGNVVEKTPIVTRIRTLKNEIITIPNSNIMSSQITNLSESARTLGLIVHLDVTFGYDVPWRKAHQILIDAAESTADVLKEPHPFVLEQAFDDFYVVYQINAYIKDADKLSQVMTALRQNIQDKVKEAGIDSTSPHYYVQK